MSSLKRRYDFNQAVLPGKYKTSLPDTQSGRLSGTKQ
jgi:hypothetical protein